MLQAQLKGLQNLIEFGVDLSTTKNPIAVGFDELVEVMFKGEKHDLPLQIDDFEGEQVFVDRILADQDFIIAREHHKIGDLAKTNLLLNFIAKCFSFFTIDKISLSQQTFDHTLAGFRIQHGNLDIEHFRDLHEA
jgi:hypothetical protein